MLSAQLHASWSCIEGTLFSVELALKRVLGCRFGAECRDELAGRPVHACSPVADRAADVGLRLRRTKCKLPLQETAVQKCLGLFSLKHV